MYGYSRPFISAMERIFISGKALTSILTVILLMTELSQ